MHFVLQMKDTTIHDKLFYRIEVFSISLHGSNAKISSLVELDALQKFDTLRILMDDLKQMRLIFTALILPDRSKSLEFILGSKLMRQS